MDVDADSDADAERKPASEAARQQMRRSPGMPPAPRKASLKWPK